MNRALTALTAYLATRRITSLITEDKITEDLRNVVWQKFSPEDTKLGYLVTCRKCSSLWAGLMALCLLSLSNTTPARFVVNALALSEASILTDKLLPQSFDL